MPDYKDFVSLIKRAALDAVEAQKPAGVYSGTVIGVNPLKVQLNQKIELDDDMLIIPQHLTNYKVDIVMDGYTRDCTVKNALKIGDAVVMVRVQGGQKYLIVDKAVST